MRCKSLFVLTAVLICIFASCTNEVPSTEVSYRVLHMKQNACDNGYSEAERESLVGMSGEMTEAVSKSYDGFTLKGTVRQKRISSKGNTVVVIYYDRNLIEISFDAGDGRFEDGSSTATRSFRYGQEIEPPEAHRDGYVPEWPDFGVVGASDVNSYSATWLLDVSTTFKVEHFYESVGGGTFTEDASKRETRSGTVGMTTRFKEKDGKTESGFTFDRVENTVLSSDGNSVVKFYYVRNRCRIILDAGGGSFSDGTTLELTGLCGENLPSFQNPTRACWDFKGWMRNEKSESLPKKFTEDTATYTAKWSMHYKLTAAVDDEGNDVLSNFSSRYETFIKIMSCTQKLNSGTVIPGTQNPSWFKFFHKDASGNSDADHFNAFWGTSRIDLDAKLITADFYGKKLEGKLSDGYGTLEMDVKCNALYSDNHKTPFGNTGTYTLTFTRQ